MPNLNLHDQNGAVVGEVDLPAEVFGCEDNQGLVHQVVVGLRANRRQGTAMTKNRALVKGGGCKPWRQKGTGRARQGTIRAPQWVGGGHAFGGQRTNYKQDLPVKMNRGALRCVLSGKLRGEAIKLVDKIEIKEIKTKAFALILKNLEVGRGSLIVHNNLPDEELLSLRNIAGVRPIRAQDLSTLDAFEARTLVLVGDAVNTLQDRLTG